MHLLVDLGNTRAKYQLVNGVETATTVVDYCHFSQTYFDSFWSHVRQIFVAGVGHQKEIEKIKRWSVQNSIAFTEIKTQKQAFGVTAGYVEHSELGVDRWLAILGAELLFPNENLLIIDSGTATTIDYLNKNKQHLGGWIIPGVDMMKASLTANTANIKIAKNEEISVDYANNTSSNVHHGCWLATSGSIKLAINIIEKQGHQINKIILSGGNCHSLIAFIDRPVEIMNDLVFTGIERYVSQQT